MNGIYASAFPSSSSLKGGRRRDYGSDGVWCLAHSELERRMGQMVMFTQALVPLARDTMAPSKDEPINLRGWKKALLIGTHFLVSISPVY